MADWLRCRTHSRQTEVTSLCQPCCQQRSGLWQELSIASESDRSHFMPDHFELSGDVVLDVKGIGKVVTEINNVVVLMCCI